MKATIQILLAIVLWSIHQPSKNTFVQIPDPHFRAKLQELYPSCFVGNHLDKNNNEITSATGLDLSNLGINDLRGIEYFTSITHLDCSSNKLKQLPPLPKHLVYLDCSYNKLNFLPELYEGLVHLECDYNQLDTLPVLPESLNSFSCSNNKLTESPSFPNTLVYWDYSCLLYTSDAADD